MKNLVRRSRNQRGMTTAEYAVGTVASVSIVGVIISIIQNPVFQELIMNIVKALIQVVIALISGS